MKKALAMFLLLSASVLAEVVVAKKVDNNPVTSAKTEHVMLAISGEGDVKANLIVMCTYGEVRGRNYNTVGLLLDTPNTVVENVRAKLPMEFRAALGNSIVTAARFEGRKMEPLEWERSDENPTILVLTRRFSRDSFKFVRDQLFNSVKLHIQLTSTRTVSFDLTGLSEEYAKHAECKQ